MYHKRGSYGILFTLAFLEIVSLKEQENTRATSQSLKILGKAAKFISAFLEIVSLKKQRNTRATSQSLKTLGIPLGDFYCVKIG